jgi:dTDP-4-dehydrorhamnose reductase
LRILVTGGKGQVGSALAVMGAEQGLDLIALGHSELDITDAASIDAAFDHYHPELLINAAAYTEVDKAETEPKLAYAINEMAVGLLADTCAHANIPMLHISSDYVFDGSKEGLYKEDDPVHPQAVYAKSKEAGERALRERLDRHIILRTSWVFGKQGNNFVKTIARLAKDREWLTVVDDQFGGPTSAQAVAEALVAIVAKYNMMGEAPWGTYHFCQKPYVNWHAFAQTIIECATEMGKLDHHVEVLPIPSSKFETNVARPKNSRLDTSKLESAFGILSSRWPKNLCEIIENL